MKIKSTYFNRVKLISLIFATCFILSIFNVQRVHATQNQIEYNNIISIGNDFLKTLYSDEEIKKHEKYSIDPAIIPIYDIEDTQIGYALDIKNNKDEIIGTMTLVYKNGNLTLSESSIDESISKKLKNFSNENKGKKNNNGDIVSDVKLIKVASLQYVAKQEIKDAKGNKSNKYYDLRKNKDATLAVENFRKNNKESTLTTTSLENTSNSISTLATTYSISGQNRLRMDFYFDGSYYGGDQRWFSDSRKADTGCGPTSLANITAYYDKYRGLSNFYNQVDYSGGQYGNFVKQMDELYSMCWQVPITGGVLPADYINGFNNYANNRGYSFNTTANLLSLNTFTGFCNTIKNGIDIDAPVGMFMENKLPFVSDNGLIIGDQSDNSYFAWHYVTITRYNFTNPSVPIITLSSWGAKYDMNLQIAADTRGDLEAIYFSNSSFTGAYKSLSVGEHITAIKSAPGIWQIAEGTNLLWCNAGPTSYYGQSSTFPMELVVNAVEPAWISPILHYLTTGEQFVAYRAVPGWWYVKWGTNYGWVNAGPTSYVGQSSSFPMTLKSDVSSLPIFKDQPY